jgi:hypothetical protein
MTMRSRNVEIMIGIVVTFFSLLAIIVEAGK